MESAGCRANKVQTVQVIQGDPPNPKFLFSGSEPLTCTNASLLKFSAVKRAKRPKMIKALTCTNVYNRRSGRPVVFTSEGTEHGGSNPLRAVEDPPGLLTGEPGGRSRERELPGLKAGRRSERS